MTYREKLQQVLTPEFLKILLDANKKTSTSTIDKESTYLLDFADRLVCWADSDEGIVFWSAVDRLARTQLNDSTEDNIICGIQIFK